MSNTNLKTYRVLLQKTTPVYTIVTVTAANEDDAAEQAIDCVEDFSCDRLPEEGVWSLIPAVGIFMPDEDSEPEVLRVSETAAETPELSAWDTEQ